MKALQAAMEDFWESGDFLKNYNTILRIFLERRLCLKNFDRALSSSLEKNRLRRANESFGWPIGPWEKNSFRTNLQKLDELGNLEK